MQIRLSGALRRLVGFRDELTLEAATVREALDRLTAEHPNLKPVIFDAGGALRGLHRLFLNSEQLDHQELDRPLTKDDRLDIVTAIAGG